MSTETNQRGYTREDIVAHARAWLGTPYHHQASLRGVGTDCLGLVRGVWRELHGADAEAVPAYSRDWAEATGVETMLAAARRHMIEQPAHDALSAGDVVIFRYRRGSVAKHAAIVTSSVTFIHAFEGAPVAEVALSPWWRRRIAAVFSFPGIVS